MKLNNITIENYRSIKQLSVDLHPTLNVFVGVNGAGKTTILDSIAMSLSWLVKRIQRIKSNGTHINEGDIRNGCDFSTVKVQVESAGVFEWKLVKTSIGSNYEGKSILQNVNKLAVETRVVADKYNSLPIALFYSVNRTVGKVAVEVNNTLGLDIFDVYNNALDISTNFQSFFEWFRLQDDILNEKISSRKKWELQNQGWIEGEIEELLKTYRELMGDEFSSFYEINYIKDYRFMFHDISNALYPREDGTLGQRLEIQYLREFEELFRNIKRLSEFSKEYIINPPIRYIGNLQSIVAELIKIIEKWKGNKYHKFVDRFLWKLFSFSLEVSLWWLSSENRKRINEKLKNVILYNLSFRSQFDKLLVELQDIFQEEILGLALEILPRNDLSIVQDVIGSFIKDYSNLRVKRTPHPHLLVDKNGESFNLEYLSDGEKNLISLVGDIARRLIIANPNAKDPTKGEGIVLIDEIDLHLHPSWQRIMIPKLQEVFPNIQFIITTHSPQVLSHIKPESIFLLKNENNELSYSKAIESYGKNTDRILEDLLGVDARPSEEKKRINQIFRYIEAGEYDVANNEIDSLSQLIGDEPELVRARVLMKRKKLIGK